jgi:hypothetical protein
MSNFPAQWGSRTTQLFDEGQSRSAFVPFQADQRPKPPLQSGLLVRNLKRANPRQPNQQCRSESASITPAIFGT